MKKVLLIIISMILCMSFTSCQNYDEPISVTEIYHDCEYTITLDKSKYDLDDTVVATVSFVNKGEKTVYLESDTFLHPLSRVVFRENGNGKYRDVDTDDIPLSGIYGGTAIAPGEGIIFIEKFDLGTPPGTEEPVKTNAEWKIIAFADAYIYNYTNGEFVQEETEEISVEIIVPH